MGKPTIVFVIICWVFHGFPMAFAAPAESPKDPPNTALFVKGCPSSTGEGVDLWMQKPRQTIGIG